MHLFTQAWFGGVSMVYQLTFYTVVVIAPKRENQTNMFGCSKIAGNIMI